jgi:predicted TIM-barrel fold metal-dependent hydrolase
VYFTADAHLMEPTDIFTRHLPTVEHMRAPIFHRLPDGTKYWTVNTVPVSISPDYQRVTSEGVERIGPDDVSGMLRDLDLDNVWGALLHPNLGLMVFDLDDPEFAMRCARIYNDHVREVYDSKRLFPTAVIPLLDVDAAVEEVRRVAQLGFKAIELPMTAPPAAPFYSHQYDVLWEVAQTHQLVISMHVGTGAKLGSSSPSLSLSAASFLAPSSTAQWPIGHPDHERAIVAAKTTTGGFGGYGGQAISAIPALVGGGVTDRFPDLHFIMVETGGRWLLNVMDTMDEAWYTGPGVNEVNRTFFATDGRRIRQFQDDELGLQWPYSLAPSDYVRRQIHVTFQDDWVALRNRQLTGIQPLIWGNDYPHNEGSWPESPLAVEKQSVRAELTSDEAAMIFGGTAATILHVSETLAFT